VSPARIRITGNTVVDALQATVSRERSRHGFWASRFALRDGRRVVLVTAHRRENFGPGLDRICTAIAQLASRFQDVAFVYPVHLNPRVQEPVRNTLSDFSNVHLWDPLPYPAFVWLMDRCHLILSDSGGIQEEAPSLASLWF